MTSSILSRGILVITVILTVSAQSAPVSPVSLDKIRALVTFERGDTSRGDTRVSSCPRRGDDGDDHEDGRRRLRVLPARVVVTVCRTNKTPVLRPLSLLDSGRRQDFLPGEHPAALSDHSVFKQVRSSFGS